MGDHDNEPQEDSILDDMIRKAWGQEESPLEEQLRRAEEESSAIEEMLKAGDRDSLLSAGSEAEDAMRKFDAVPLPDIFMHPPMPEQKPAPEPAKDFFHVLQSEFRKMEALLEENQQLLVLHYDAAGNETTVTAFGYHPPDLVILNGVERVVVAHVSSLQVSLNIVQLEAEESKRPIGFHRLEPEG